MKPVVLLVLVAVVCTWAACYHSAPKKMTSLHGLTEARVIDKLGLPEQSSVFPVGEGQPEFRVELLNFYPPPTARTTPS